MEFFYQYNSFIGSFELYNLLAWVVIWTPFLTDKVVLFYSDNTSTVYALHNKALDSNPMMFLLWYITLFSMTHNINILPKHIRSKDSIISDLLHQFKFQGSHDVKPEKTKFSPSTPDSQIYLLDTCMFKVWYYQLTGIIHWDNSVMRSMDTAQ